MAPDVLFGEAGKKEDTVKATEKCWKEKQRGKVEANLPSIKHSTLLIYVSKSGEERVLGDDVIGIQDPKKERPGQWDYRRSLQKEKLSSEYLL